jgi:hypothetical protein
MASTRTFLATLAAVGLAACGSAADRSNRFSDAPEARIIAGGQRQGPASYEAALRAWRSAEDVSAWIAENFQYDMSRAMLLSETQRLRNGRSRRARVSDIGPIWLAPGRALKRFPPTRHVGP